MTEDDDDKDGGDTKSGAVSSQSNCIVSDRLSEDAATAGVARYPRRSAVTYTSVAPCSAVSTCPGRVSETSVHFNMPFWRDAGEVR